MSDFFVEQHGSILQLDGISKFYGGIPAMTDVSLSVDPGEVVALMGANGAGKSTLAKIASGVVKPDQGRIFVAGREVKLADPKAAHSHGIFIVHQSTDQLGVPGLSVAENLVLDELCRGSLGSLIGKRKLRQRARSIAAGIGLDLPLDSDFGDLGPAHRQLVAIARAVATKSSILIFDEPTASLGATEASRLFAVIDRLRSRGVGILYISHRLADLQRLADRVVVLRNGQTVLEQARPLDFSTAIQAMIGRVFQQPSRNGSIADEKLLNLVQVRLRQNSEPFDLSIRGGEIVAVTGTLGSGKSRLLRALFGLSRFAAGKIFLEGKSWLPTTPAAAISHGVFMAGEDRWRSSLLPPLTLGADIAGTIALPHRRRWFRSGWVRPARERAAAAKAIKALGIRCRSTQDTLDLLSGGNQQKVVIGRWQAEPCRLLLLDEPFQGVDVGSRRDLIQALRSARHGAATLVATSDIEEAIEVADVVAVMRDHTIVGFHGLGAGITSSLLNAISSLETTQLETTEGWVA